MQVSEKIRLSNEQVATLDAGELVTIPALWEEFEDFLDETGYRTEYQEGQIIVAGLVKFIHEVLVSRIICILTGFYLDQSFT